MKITIPKSGIFSFGEIVDEYEVRVLNEREVRAGSGILFLFAMIAFSSAWFTGNFYFMKIFVTFFVLDFLIRIIVNPRYSPSLVLGRFIVRNQTVEYSGAPQKKFAWSLGLILGITMFYLVVVQQSFGPINLVLCITCLTLLFFETAFGICIGCKIYNLIKKEDAKLCPGGVCTPHETVEIQKISIFQTLATISILMVMFIIIVSGTFAEKRTYTGPQTINESETIDEECIVPDWAIDIGHEEQWKLHNGCR